MILASEEYKKYQKEIDFEMAKNKLATGSKGYKGIHIIRKVLSLVDKSKELHYYDDLSNIYIKQMKVLNEIKDSGISYLFESNDVTSKYISSNLDAINYKDDSNRSLTIDGHSNTKILKISTFNPTSLKDFSDVEKCLLGYNPNSFQGNFVSINLDSYSLSNCFNNQHYDYVHLSGTKTTASHMNCFNCFNNCTIGTLIIDDTKFSKKISLYDCFKFTSANNIQIACKDDKIKHLINRLTYMRGVRNV